MSRKVFHKSATRKAMTWDGFGARAPLLHHCDFEQVWIEQPHVARSTRFAIAFLTEVGEPVGQASRVSGLLSRAGRAWHEGATPPPASAPAVEWITTPEELDSLGGAISELAYRFVAALQHKESVSRVRVSFLGSYDEDSEEGLLFDIWLTLGDVDEYFSAFDELCETLERLEGKLGVHSGRSAIVPHRAEHAGE